MKTPDLINALRRIEQRAQDALVRVARGEATTGTSALDKIRTDAQDTVRHYEKENPCEEV